jgi:hypothetical protein
VHVYDKSWEFTEKLNDISADKKVNVLKIKKKHSPIK